MVGRPAYNRLGKHFLGRLPMRVIEVMATRAAFGDLMADMRQWLDRNECPLVRCETERGGIRILVKAHFEDNALAERFRQAFRGSYAG